MKHPLPNLECLKVFESAARHLSFSAAADELCITKGAVSYQIKKLESELATRLFKRSVRQVLLTDQGQKLYQEVRKMFANLENTLSGLAAAIDNTITIAVTTYVAARWLSPRISQFCEQHPETTVQYVHTVNSDSFDINDVDIAIRWDSCENNSDPLCAGTIPMPLFVVASPEVTQDLDNSPNTLEGHTLLCEDRRQDLWTEWANKEISLENCTRRTIADANVRVQAAINGMGLIMADDLMNFEIKNGLLDKTVERKLNGYGYTILLNPLSRHRVQVHALMQTIFPDFVDNQALSG